MVLLTVYVAVAQVQTEINPYDYVSLVYNTDECFDCYSIYEVTAPYDGFVIDEQTFWFEFRDVKDLELRHANQVPDLNSHSVLYETSVQEPVYERIVTDMCSEEFNKDLNKTVKDCFDYEELTGYDTKIVWQNLGSHTLKKGEKLKIKVKGSIDWYGNVDNVMTIKINDEYEKLTAWAWWNNNWGNRTCLNFTASYTYTNEPVYLNWTPINIASTNASQEMRLLFNGNEIQYDIITNGTNWFYLLWLQNATSSNFYTGDNSTCLYYNNAGASTRTVTDMVVVDTTGDDTIDSESSMYNLQGYDDVTIDMNGGTLISFKLDGGTQILDESYYDLFTHDYQTAGQEFYHTDVDDLCTLIEDSNFLRTIYLCECGEDGADLDGNCDNTAELRHIEGCAESGETSYTYIFYPDTIDVVINSSYAGNGEFNMQFNIDEGVDGNWYFDSSNTANSYQVVSNGYIVNDLTTTDNLFIVFDEDYQPAPIGTSEWNLYGDANWDQAGWGLISGDAYRLTQNFDNIARLRVTGAVGSLNTEGQLQENIFDNPLSFTLDDEETNATSYDDTVSLSETFTTPTYELINRTYLANFSYGANVTQVIPLSFEWDNSTNYTAVYVSNGSNWTAYNYSIVIPVIHVNTTTFEHSWFYNVSFDNGTSNVTVETSKSNTVVWFGYYINSSNTTNNGDIFMGADSIVTTVITDHSDFGDLTMDTEWNNTNYSATTSDNITWTYTYTTPVVTANYTVNQTSFLNISYGGDYDVRNGSQINQTIIYLNVSSGAGCTPLVMFFDYYDENVTTNNISVDTETVITYTYLDTEYEYNFSSEGVNNDSFCINYNLTDLEILHLVKDTSGVDDDYYRREYRDQLDIDTTESQNLSIYLLNISLSDATQTNIYVTDETDIALEGYFVHVYKYSIADNNYTFMEAFESDSDGKGIISNREESYYRFQVFEPDWDLVEESDTFKLLSADLYLRIGEVNMELERARNVINIDHNLTWDNTTRIITFEWDDEDNVATNLCLRVSLWNATNMSVLNDTCSTDQTGSITYNVGTTQARFLIYAYEEGSLYVIDMLGISTLSDPLDWGTEGLIIGIIWFLSIAMIGLGVTPLTSLVMAEVGFISLVTMGFVTLQAPAIMSIIVGLVLIILMKLRN